jgi:cell wall-associated NlpC family hydrolase
LIKANARDIARGYLARCIAGLLMGIAYCGAQAGEVAADDGPANAAAESIYDEAMRILRSIKATEYKHKTDIDEDNGAYYCDCSGFVGYVLNRTVAQGDGKGPFGDGKKRPLAMDYEKGFAAAPVKADDGTRWLRIERLMDARPGDVIAWRHEVPKPGNTGHVVILAERPTVDDDGLVRVVVIDSTTKPQVDDTRAAGTSGIGRGSMWFKVDDSGKAVSYLRGSKKAEPKSEAISIGRALPLSKKGVSRKAA